MRIIDIESILGNMKDETAFILKCEEVFHDKISGAAVKILAHRAEKPILCLSGPSGSGKTTTAMRLRDYLENLGVKVCMLSMDNFFIPEKKRPPEATDWESPFCVDFERLMNAATSLADGKETELPLYDFKTNDIGGSFKMQGDKDAVILIEGIHMLNPMIFDRFKGRAQGIYVAPRTRIVTPQDRVLRPEQIRIVRRMVRDYEGRGRSFKDTVLKAESVDAGEMQYITPYKDNASIHIDTFHDYEPCILAQYFREVTKDAVEELTPEFIKQYKLTELYKVFPVLPDINTTYIPKDSIVREFIGGSIYEY